MSWTDLGGGVRVRQSRAFHMNSALLLDREHAVVIDAGVLPSEIDDIAAAHREARAARTSLFPTHAHWDHVLARPWWPDAEVIAHDRFAAELAAGAAHTLAEAGRIAREHGETWTRGFQPYRPAHAVSGLHYAQRGPWHLVFRDAPGHSGSQLTLHLPDRRILFAADMLSDIEIPILDAPPAVYRHTLEPLLQLVDSGAVDTLVPGHGAIAHGDTVRARIIDDLAYLDELAHRATESAHAGRDLAATQAGLATMDYRGKTGGPYPMADIHRDNIAHAWQAAKTPHKGKPAPPKR